ncbi:MAG: hypothetical protein ACSHYF_14685 [Verrucomicrobiaceae bacterium]
MDSELKQIEAELQKLAPQGMPDDLLSRLDDAMSRWHETVPVEEKVISLSDSQKIEAGRSEGWFQWKAVAGVAIFGAAAAVMLSNQGSEAPQEVENPVQVQQGVSLASFKPKSAKAEVLGLQDRGTISTANGVTVKCVGVKVSNQIDFQNANGDKVRVERPSYEVIFVPLDVD